MISRERTGADLAGGVPAAGAGDLTRGVPVADPEEIAGRLFLSVARLIRRLRHGDPTPLGPGAISALGTIVTDGPIRLGDLASVEGVRAPTMTRIVDALVTDGNVERIPDPADGRACLVRATESGCQVIAGARTARSRQLIERMSHLDRSQLDALYAALPALEALCSDDPARTVDPTRAGDLSRGGGTAGAGDPTRAGDLSRAGGAAGAGDRAQVARGITR
jgi:DNA-binding MarR family transcriptional regulator